MPKHMRRRRNIMDFLSGAILIIEAGIKIYLRKKDQLRQLKAIIFTKMYQL